MSVQTHHPGIIAPIDLTFFTQEVLAMWLDPDRDLRSEMY